MLRSLTLLSFLILATSSFSQLIKYPKASITLKIQQSKGTNGCGVAYNPSKGLYYATFAGNSEFPLEVFDKNGNPVFQTTVGNDIRGFWWNAKTKELEANCYGNGGLIAMKLNEQGYPSLGNTQVLEGKTLQPNDNACGAFDGKKLLHYFDNNSLSMAIYSRKDGSYQKGVLFDIEGFLLEKCNATSLIYTGKKKMEIGLLNFRDKKIYLFNKKSGELTATVFLPQTAITHHAFRFAYCNNTVFLYDVNNREWKGYQIFE